MHNKHLRTIILFFAFAGFNLQKTNAQNIAISNDGSAPHNSAMLDVKHANQGILVPRVALTGTNDVATIPSPATSLLVFNTAIAGTGLNEVTAGYYYWGGSAWLRLGTVLPGSGLWLLAGNAGTIDGSSFIGTTDNVPFNIRMNNQKAGRIDSASQNTFWGYRAGDSTAASGNTAVGYKALFSNLYGYSNTATGYNALYLNQWFGNI